VVAPQVLSRALWIASAAVAAAALSVLALQGERPATHVSVFAAAGVMRHIPPEEVEHVEVAAGSRSWQFTRKPAGWESSAATQASSAKTGASIEQGLRLLHNSAPERTLTGAEASDPAAFGLVSPALTVTVKGRERFSIAFGGTNPLGLARYARVQGRSDVILLPRYVADAWEDVVGLGTQ
jgi:hypothetical protein